MVAFRYRCKQGRSCLFLFRDIQMTPNSWSKFGSSRPVRLLYINVLHLRIANSRYRVMPMNVGDHLSVENASHSEIPLRRARVSGVFPPLSWNASAVVSHLNLFTFQIYNRSKMSFSVAGVAFICAVAIVFHVCNDF